MRSSKMKKKMGECGKAAKILLITFNLLILCASLVSLSIGIYAVVELNDYNTIILGVQMYTTAAYLLIIAGAVTLIMAFIGCMGALRENKCMLITFFTILFFVFVLLFVGGILAYVYRLEATTSIKENMEQSLQKRYGIGVKSSADCNENVLNIAATDTWDVIQKHFQCCGVGNFTIPRDWEYWRTSEWCLSPREAPENLSQPPQNKQCVPNSCCGRAVQEDGGPGCDRTEIYAHGCYYKLYNYLSDNAAIIGGIGIGTSAIPIIGMILVVILYRQI